MTSPSAARAAAEDFLLGTDSSNTPIEPQDARRVVTALLEALRSDDTARANGQLWNRVQELEREVEALREHATTKPDLLDFEDGDFPPAEEDDPPAAAPPEPPPTCDDEPPWPGWFSCEGCYGWFNDEGNAYDDGAVLCDACAKERDEADSPLGPSLTVERLAELLREAELVLRGPDNYDALAAWLLPRLAGPAQERPELLCPVCGFRVCECRV